MTVSSTTRKAGPFLGNGVSTSFPFSFKVFTAADLEVTRTSADGTTAVLTLDSDYSVSRNADQDNNPGGTVTYPATGTVKLAVGEQLTVLSDVPAQQATDITNLGRFLPRVIENAFDYLTILVQQLLEKTSRGMYAPVTDPSPVGPLPSAEDRAGGYLAFDAQGDPIATVGTGADASLRTDLAASSGASLVGWLQAGTGARSRSAQDKMREQVSIKDFGAIGDGTTHPLSERYATLTAAQIDYPFATSLAQSIDWAACMAATAAVGYGGTVYVPNGEYRLSGEWSIKKTVTILGSNAGDYSTLRGSILKFPADSNGLRFYSFADNAGTSTADKSIVERINLEATAKNVSGVGIYSTCVVRIDDCIVRSFKSHGIELYGNVGSPQVGIVDFWKVANTRILGNGGHGLYVHGNDSQVGVAQQVECMSNDGWGMYDNAEYSNTYIACQASGNVLGSYYNAPRSTFFGSIYIGCYAESFQDANLNNQGLVIGGVMDWQTNMALMPCVAPGGFAWNVSGGGNVHLLMRNGVEIGRIDNSGFLTGFPGYWASDPASTNNYCRTSVNEIVMNTTVAGAQNRMVYSVQGVGAVGTIVSSSGGTTYNTISDHRLKTDVQPMTGALDKVMKLNPVSYKWKFDGASGQGFIAHELQEIVPECVTGEKDATQEVDVVETVVEDVLDRKGNKVGERLVGKVTGRQMVPKHQGVDTSFLMATLVSAVQEQQAQLNDLAALVRGTAP